MISNLKSFWFASSHGQQWLVPIRNISGQEIRGPPLQILHNISCQHCTFFTQVLGALKHCQASAGKPNLGVWEQSLIQILTLTDAHRERKITSRIAGFVLSSYIAFLYTEAGFIVYNLRKYRKAKEAIAAANACRENQSEFRCDQVCLETRRNYLA